MLFRFKHLKASQRIEYVLGHRLITQGTYFSSFHEGFVIHEVLLRCEQN